MKVTDFKLIKNEKRDRLNESVLITADAFKKLGKACLIATKTLESSMSVILSLSTKKEKPIF